MPRKVFQIKVELYIQAVTCPGVWLCPTGEVSLQWYMLDSCIQTKDYDPSFPILCHEKYQFCKIFDEAQRLSDIQNLLTNEYVYVELIQWKTVEVGYVLASFHTSLNELLYPKLFGKAKAGVDVDLLMIPSNNFPGILAPKIEISTRTTIEEILCSKSQKKSNAIIINPKVIQSQDGNNRPPLHQKKVCHTATYHAHLSHHYPLSTKRSRGKNKLHKRPPFLLDLKCEDVISRVPYEQSCPDLCLCKSRKMDTPKSTVKVLRSPASKACNHTHFVFECPICFKYKNHFSTCCCSHGQYVPELKSRRKKLLSKSQECIPSVESVSTQSYQEEEKPKMSQKCCCKCGGCNSIKSSIDSGSRKTRKVDCRDGRDTDSSEESSNCLCDSRCNIRENLSNFYDKLISK